MAGNNNEKNKRSIHPRSLENLKLGPETRNQDKIRRNTTLLPETIEWLEKYGNVSSTIDALVANAKNKEFELSSSDTHELITEEVSSDTHDRIIELETLRSRLATVENERDTLQLQVVAKNKELLDQAQIENNLLEENKKLQIELEGQRLKNKELESQTEADFEYLHSELLDREDTIQKVTQERDQIQAKHKDLLQENEALRTELQKVKIVNQQPAVNTREADPRAIALLQSAITAKAKGGSYAANNATGVKKLIEQALTLLKKK